MSNRLKLEHLPRFPSQIIGETGIGAVQAKGIWTVGFDYTNLPLVSPYTPVATDYILMFNSITQRFFLVPATSFL